MRQLLGETQAGMLRLLLLLPVCIGYQGGWQDGPVGQRTGSCLLLAATGASSMGGSGSGGGAASNAGQRWRGNHQRGQRHRCHC
jgi:hypothetical protein